MLPLTWLNKVELAGLMIWLCHRGYFESNSQAEMEQSTLCVKVSKSKGLGITKNYGLMNDVVVDKNDCTAMGLRATDWQEDSFECMIVCYFELERGF